MTLDLFPVSGGILTSQTAGNKFVKKTFTTAAAGHFLGPQQLKI